MTKNKSFQHVWEEPAKELTEAEVLETFHLMKDDKECRYFSSFDWYQAGIETAELLHGIKT